MTTQKFRFFNEHPTYVFNLPLNTGSWLKKVLKKENIALQGDVNYIFVDEISLLEINRTHLNHNYHTDIITFQWEQDKIAGDIYISVDFIRNYSQEQNIPFLVELSRVVVHGLLHMIGYNDKTREEQEVMRQKEDLYLLLHPLLK